MKKLFCLCSLVLVIVSACTKNDYTEEQAAYDDALIRGYISKYSLKDVEKDPSGLYYQIITQGTGATPNTNSTILVNYTSYFLEKPSSDGTPISTDGVVQFESKAGASVKLSSMVKGWQIGLPKLKAVGKIRLMIPSALAYGPEGRGVIQANSVLVYLVDLSDVK